ncbi:recombinase family protein [Dactylosporangium sp. NPDC049140]|uniref:recombinase family protein n=1 Tax=Dactylosporangium sp. NPDC049140 TaxID=3155647 RepID=UPI0033DF0EC0
MPPLAPRAAGYARQSRGRDNRSDVSLATQRDALRARANLIGAQWVGHYEDVGISAFSGAARPAFDQLVSDCRAGRVNAIIVYNISRLSRAAALDSVPLVTELLSRGITIISITEGEFRPGDLMGLIRLIMHLDAAHTESRNKSIVISAAKAAARELGGYLSGKPPYGFRLVPESRRNSEGRPIVIQRLARQDHEAAVIRRLVGRILDGDSTVTVAGLAGTLNADAVPTRGATVGKQTAHSAWGARTLERILRDPRIAGFAAEVVYSNRPRPDGRRSASIAGYRIVRDADGNPVEAHPRIIEADTWFRLQDRLDRRPPPATPLDPPRQPLLSALGLLYCECGAPMRSHRNSRRGFRSAYRCSRARGPHRPGEHPRDCTVSQAALDEYVARRIFALIATAAGDADAAEILTEATRRFGLTSADPCAQARRGSIAAELDGTERTLDRLHADRPRGGYSRVAARHRYLESVRDLTARIEKLAGELAETDTSELPVGRWLGDAGTDPLGPSSWWCGASVSARRAFVALFVRRVTITEAASPVEDRTTIDWVSPAGFS